MDWRIVVEALKDCDGVGDLDYPHHPTLITLLHNYATKNTPLRLVDIVADLKFFYGTGPEEWKALLNAYEMMSEEDPGKRRDLLIDWAIRKVEEQNEN